MSRTPPSLLPLRSKNDVACFLPLYALYWISSNVLYMMLRSPGHSKNWGKRVLCNAVKEICELRRRCLSMIDAV
jgi:hypothetical protein